MRAAPPIDAARLGAPPACLDALAAHGGDARAAAAATDRADHLVVFLALDGVPLPDLIACAVPSALDRAPLAPQHADAVRRAFDDWAGERASHGAIEVALREPVLAASPDGPHDAWLNALGDLAFAARFCERGDTAAAVSACHDAMERLGFAIARVPFGEMTDPGYLSALAQLAAEIRARVADDPTAAH